MNIMKRKNLLSVVSAITVISVISSCGAAERSDMPAITDGNITTSVSVTSIDELDIETDWESMAEIEEIDVKNEEGTGPLYVSGKKAGLVKALCYYDLATTQSDLAELLAQRYGGTIETEVTSSGSAYFEKLGALIAAGDSPDIVRYDWMALLIPQKHLLMESFCFLVWDFHGNMKALRNLSSRKILMVSLRLFLFLEM